MKEFPTKGKGFARHVMLLDKEATVKYQASARAPGSTDHFTEKEEENGSQHEILKVDSKNHFTQRTCNDAQTCQ